MNKSKAPPQSDSQARSTRSSHAEGASGPIDVQYEQVESLDKVREILFGTQSKNLEEKINREAGEIKNDIQVRLDAFGGFVKNEFETITQQAKVEKTERLNAGKEFAEQLKELHKLVESKFSYLEEQSLKGQKELRQQLLDQNKTLSNEIQSKSDSIKDALDQGSQEMNEIKVDRVLLAELLMKLAVDLNGGHKILKSK